MIWEARYAKGVKYYIEAERWYDAREAARRAFGAPTYDGLQVAEGRTRAPHYRVYYTGNAFNSTLQRHIERI